MGGRVFIQYNGFNPVTRIPTNDLQTFQEIVLKNKIFIELITNKIIKKFIIGTNDLDIVKPDHGDLDIIVKSCHQQQISTAFIEAGFEVKTNGSMIHIMFPFKDTFHQLDIIVFKTAEEYQMGSLFYSNPVVFNAVIGHFARSLGYKFSIRGFLLHITDIKGQDYYYPLTKNYEIGFKLLGLELNPGYNIYESPKIFANWIIKSERFDLSFFKKSSNQQSHRDAKKNDFCNEVYNIISNSNVKSKYKPIPFNIQNKLEKESREEYAQKSLKLESKILNDNTLIHGVLSFIADHERIDAKILTGKDLIELGYIPGPQFRKILNWAKKNENTLKVMNKEEIELAITYNFIV